MKIMSTLQGYRMDYLEMLQLIEKQYKTTVFPPVSPFIQIWLLHGETAL